LESDDEYKGPNAADFVIDEDSEEEYEEEKNEKGKDSEASEAEFVDSSDATESSSEESAAASSSSDEDDSEDVKKKWMKLATTKKAFSVGLSPTLGGRQADPDLGEFSHQGDCSKPHWPVKMSARQSSGGGVKRCHQKKCISTDCSRVTAYMCRACGVPMCFSLPTNDSRVGCFFSLHNIVSNVERTKRLLDTVMLQRVFGNGKKVKLVK
jgi:hypothetical protein